MSALVSRLLSHYWTADDHPAARQAQLEDWIDDLADYPIEAIRTACSAWRRAERRRPTPADILSLIRPGQIAEERAAPRIFDHITNDELETKAANRRQIAPLWRFVRRALTGEDPDKLIAEMRDEANP